MAELERVADEAARFVAVDTPAGRDVSILQPKAEPELIRLVSTADLYPTEGQVDQAQGV